MKVILVGASGTIGSSLSAYLSENHSVVKASANNSMVKVDISSADSIQEMYKSVGSFDAVICTAGSAFFGPLNAMSEEHFYIGIRNKLMGQINLVMIGKEYIKPGGRFVLTSGVLADRPSEQSTGLSIVNGALNSFVKSASIELPKDIKINAVSPGLVEDSAKKFGAFYPNAKPVSMELLNKTYEEALTSNYTGQVLSLY